jgi:4'-phosphopantetheinyl transferase
LSETTEWRETSKSPPLGQFDIHVWRIDLRRDDIEEARLESCLISAEHKRAACFHFARDRRRFIIRRAVLRHLLGSYLGCRPEALCLSHTIHGKPFLEQKKKLDRLGFSCSHSADLALIALARGREIGIDLEFHRPLPEASEMAGAFFSPLEIAELRKAPEALKEQIFFDCWTRKEAFVKAIGCGLSFPLDRFSVSISPDQPATLLYIKNDSQAIERWFMQSFDVGPRSSSALVFEGRNAIVKHFEWSSRHLI